MPMVGGLQLVSMMTVSPVCRSVPIRSSANPPTRCSAAVSSKSIPNTSDSTSLLSSSHWVKWCASCAHTSRTGTGLMRLKTGMSAMTEA